VTDQEVTDQDVEFACVAEEGDELRPMSVRYGVTADEAGHREPLALALSQEEPEQLVDVDGTWDDLEPGVRDLPRTHPRSLPDSLDEEQIAVAAEQAAMH
jgi:hypothetical protein